MDPATMATTALLELGKLVVGELVKRGIDLGPIPPDASAWERMFDRFDKELARRKRQRNDADDEIPTKPKA